MALLAGFRTDRNSDKTAIKKSKSNITTNAKRKSSSNIAGQIQSMIAMAETKLSKYKDQYIIIRELQELENYINAIIENGIGTLDTETTGLDTMEVDIAGLCLYTVGQKPCYIPINHESYITGIRTANQLTEEQVAKQLQRCVDNNVDWIMHNAKYDIRICRHTLGVYLKCYWDTMIAAYCIDENEPHGLKEQHLKYCKTQDTEALKIDNLFNGLTFTKIPITTAYLYAAGDAIKTYDLYQYQADVFTQKDMEKVYTLFRNIEMPIIDVVANMEDRGVTLDKDYANKLIEKYHKIQEEKLIKIDGALAMYQDKIDEYKMSHLGHKLSEPLNVKSPAQLAILFYDILKLQSPSKKSPRGTGEDILVEFAKGKEKNLCEAILELRGVEKLLSTYIDKMPEIVKKDGRIHCQYNQYGAKTGRFSSNEPNMQNIPSHNKDIRQMFKAQDGYVLIGADYSQQEPMVTAHLSNDKKMIQAFTDGKDIYATIAALSFHKPYDECKEFRPDGTTNPAGKERRSQAKSIVLGILYGRQIPSIAKQLNVSVKEAQGIYNAVLKAFPELADFIKQSQKDAKEKGYVDTAWGRRRHLTDMQLEKYEFELKDGVPVDFDPLAFEQEVSTEVPEKTRKEFIKRLDGAYGFARKKAILEEASQRGIKIKDNGGFIAQAERQCVNARVQGSAADMTKLSMILIDTDERMKELDFHLILQVHDEVIGECPKENAKECAERLSYLMRTAPSNLIKLPLKCDTEITNNWYGKEVDYNE